RGLVEKKYPEVRWCVYEPLGANSANEAAAVAYGAELRGVPQIADADVILALDCDFLGCEEGTIEGIKSFASRRRAKESGESMNRLYVVENHFTVTGGMADHRLRCPASQIGGFALALAEQLGGA